MNDFAGNADAIAKKLVAEGMDPRQAMTMALGTGRQPSGSLALRPTQNMAVLGKSMTPPGLPESVVSDTVGIIKNMDDASVIATASRITGLPFDSPIQARLMLEKMFAGGASISAGVSGTGSELPQRLTGYEVGARVPALGGQVGVEATIPRGQGSPAINFNYRRQFQEGGTVLASDTDKIAEQLIAGGVDPQQAMTLALRMAQSRQQADQSILGGVPTQPPVSDVPPATEILGGDPSKLFQRQPTTMERIKDLPKDVLGAGEALVSMGSLAALAPASMLYALRPGQKAQGDPMEFALRNMYMPRSERGPSHLAGLGDVLGALPQTGPLPELQAFTGVGRGVGRQLAEKGRQAGRAMAPAAANVAEDILRRQGLLMDVVKPKGGQFIGGDVPENIDRQLKRLKSRYDPEVALEDVRQMRQQFGDLPRYAEAERTITNQKAVDQWIDRNLSNYVKKEMGTPEDPVRKLAESGVTHIQERYDEPGLTTVIKRKEAGFPEQGIGQSPEARSWENLSDRSIDDYLAGTVQPQAEYVKDFERLNKELSDFGRQITKRFFNERTERLVRQGETPENAQQIISDFIVNRSPGELARELNDSDLLKQYSTLRARTNYARSLLDQEYANILRENPWVEKLDPNTRLYTARTENLQFDHIVDVLRDDLDSGRIRPEQLSKVSMADAVRRTYEFDQEMAKKAEQAQAELANKLLNESPFKVYDNGYKWVKLPDPASSDEAMKLVQDIGCQGGWCTQKETNALYYGAHGEGNNLFVLMSPDKRVHAQIHVQSPEKPYDFDALMSDPQTKAQAAQAVREWRQRNPNVETPLADDQIYQALREAGIPEQSPAISEIKPRANSWTSQMVADQVAKDPEYKNTIRSMLSDFVQTTKYPVEWDLENAGLVAIDRASDLAKAMRAAKEEVPRYVTNEELSKLLQKYVPQRYKQGGSVNHKAVASARRALEKAMAKGGAVKMSGGGSMLGRAAKAGAKAAKAGSEAAERIAKNLQEAADKGQVVATPAEIDRALAVSAKRIGKDNPKLSPDEVEKKAARDVETRLKWERIERPSVVKEFGQLVDEPYTAPKARRLQNVPAEVEARAAAAEEFLRQPTEPWQPPKPGLQAFDRSLIKESLEGFPGVEQTRFPRYQPARADIGYVGEMYDNPRNRELIKQQIKRGLPLGGETFYGSLYPLKVAALERGIPAEKFEQFIYQTAPASARNSIMNEMAVGQFLRDMNARGLPLDEQTVAKEMANFKQKYGIGLPLMPVHRQGVQQVIEGGTNLREQVKADIPTNYKIPTYGTQKAGDFGKSVVLDVHEAAGETLGSQYHPYFTRQGGFGPTEYGIAESKMLDIANELGIPGGMAQAGRWFGGGELTGLKSPRGDALDLLEKQTAYTLQGQGIKPTPRNVRNYILDMIDTGQGVLMPYFKSEAMPDVRTMKKKGGAVKLGGLSALRK